MNTYDRDSFLVGLAYGLFDLAWPDSLILACEQEEEQEDNNGT